jgi:hypothetical protein
LGIEAKAKFVQTHKEVIEKELALADGQQGRVFSPQLSVVSMNTGRQSKSETRNWKFGSLKLDRFRVSSF